MDETTWLACPDPTPMLEWLSPSGRASERKLRLFAVACCRRIWHLLTDERSRQTVGLAERFADGSATRAELNGAWEAAREVAWEAARQSTTATPAWSAARAASWTSGRNAERGAVGVGLAAVWAAKEMGREKAAERGAQADLLRDIFNPWMSAPDSAVLQWQDATVPKLARRIYDENRFEDMPILADALEEAGCAEPDLLHHCRQQGGLHVHGCWLLDLLLDKE